MLSYITVDPSPIAFHIPGIDWPVRWYGILMALGFYLALRLFAQMMTQYLAKKNYSNAQEMAERFSDKATWLSILGAVIGARLGDLLFYEPQRFFSDPMRFFRVWEGGLASHGGTVGMLIAMYLFSRAIAKQVPNFTFLALLDIVVGPIAATGCFIRLGNFCNQEILGAPTTMPWGFIFLHSYDHMGPIPRHPAQLYEAAVYFVIAIALLGLYKRLMHTVGSGLYLGLFFTSVFGARFLIEFIKMPQATGFDSQQSLLYMGQWLSLPFILVGLALLIRLKFTAQRAI